MRICVVGCGAVGSIFAASLARLDDVEVWALDADTRHVDAINERGLRLSGLADVMARVRATTDATTLPACDYGIVATKSVHTREAIAAAAQAFREAAVCSVQNGVGNEELIAEHVERVIRGTTFPAGRVLEPGHVRLDASGETWIGPFEPSPAPFETVVALAETLSRGGMRTHALEDARGAQWTKLVFNAAINPVAALTGLTHGRIWEYAPTQELVRALAAEGAAVAAALDIALDSDPIAMLEHGAAVAYDHEPSMLQDVLARRPTEIDFLNGAISTRGRDAGVATPLNDAVQVLVKGLERARAEP